jgi:ATP-binding cassette subfamily F protein 3
MIAFCWTCAPTGSGSWRAERSSRSKAISMPIAASCWGARSQSARTARQSDPREGEQRREAAEKRARWPLRKRIDAAEIRIAKLNDLIARVDKVLGDPRTFREDPAKAAQLGGQRRELERALAAAEEEWLALPADYEQALA